MPVQLPAFASIRHAETIKTEKRPKSYSFFVTNLFCVQHSANPDNYLRLFSLACLLGAIRQFSYHHDPLEVNCWNYLLNVVPDNSLYALGYVFRSRDFLGPSQNVSRVGDDDRVSVGAADVDTDVVGHDQSRNGIHADTRSNRCSNIHFLDLFAARVQRQTYTH
jgi:hypothetical protein